MGALVQNTVVPNDGTLVAQPVDRDPKTITFHGVASPIVDIDNYPLTYTNSRWFAFFYEAEESNLRRCLPEPLVLEDDVVEFWYVNHNWSMAGPYLEFGITLAASYTAPDGTKYIGGYYPWMYLTMPSGVAYGREPYGFPKKVAHISVLEYGGRRHDGYDDKELQQTKGVSYPNDFFSFYLERKGYLLHTATGRYSDRELPRMAIFYGQPGWGRFNMKIKTNPDLKSSTWELGFLFPDWPVGSGKPRFALKPESVRRATAEDISTWYMASSPWDFFGAMVPPRRLLGLFSYSFDLYIPFATLIWSKTVERTDEEVAQLGTATPYRYSIRQRFPKPVGM